MEEICPACGAAPVDGKDCQSIFEEFLALEFSDPAYGEVHFLTVACYMIQHGRYSDEAQVWVKEQLRRYLEEGATTNGIRASAGSTVQNGSRNWSILRPKDAPPVHPVPWSMRITDVAREFIDAESYRRLIRQWARVTLSEMH